jgi:hypothetical protein
MEYFILNKNLKIPSLGFHVRPDKKNELNYYSKYKILSSNKLIIFLDFKNQYIQFNNSNKKNFYIAPFVKDLLHLKELNYSFQFIIIDTLDNSLINFCKKNNIFPIFFFNYNKLISESKNLFLKNFNYLNQELIIRILIENNIIIICENNLNNFKFELFLGDLSDNLINKIKY